jgi:dihydrofolate reductase
VAERDKRYPNMGLIVATAQNREIGYKKELICRIKEDLEFFKKITMDSYVIMGRNTYESMPKNLPRRKYIVLSRDEKFNLEPPKIVHRSLEETLVFVSQERESTFWVIGGEIIYTNFLPYIDTMHITEISATYPDADAFFPEFNKDEWHENAGEKLYCPKNDVNYRHLLYLRK